MKEHTKSLGKVVMTPKGAWSIEKEYEILDIVYDSVTDHAYVSKQEVPLGVDLSDSRYWMPLNVSGYSDSNVITLNSFNKDGEIQSYTLEEAIKTIKDIGRKSGAILIFYNNNVNRLDVTTGCWEIWQFNSINTYDWENLDAWINVYYNYNKFVGWYAADNTLNKEIPNPDVGCYAFVGNIYNEAFVYRCDVKNQWTKTNQKAQHYIKVVFGNNVTIGANGRWWQDGIDTNIPVSVKGDNGLTPYLRWSINNQIEYSYDGIHWYILSDRFATNIKIKDYVNTINDLPNNIELGSIYGVGPTYVENDTEHANPIYRLYVLTNNGWIDNGIFHGISAGVVQEIGNSETEVMSQRAVTEKFNELESEIAPKDNDFDFSIVDENDYEILRCTDGHIETKNFNSKKSPTVEGVDDGYDFSIVDENETAILAIESGHVKTKNFNSEEITNNIKSLKEKIYNEITVNITDFNNNLVTVFNNIKPSYENRFIVVIPEGTYDVKSWFDSDYDGKGLEIPDYVKLKGEGRTDKIILIWNNEVDDYKQWTSTLNTCNWNEIENLTVVAKGIRYAVHDDLFENAGPRYLRIKNCVFEADCSRAWGGGCTYKYDGVFENCTFKLVEGRFYQGGDYVEPFVLHDYVTSKSDSNITFKGCKFITNKPNKSSLSLGFRQSVGTLHATIVGCSFSTFIQIGTNYDNVRVKGYANKFGSEEFAKYADGTNENINDIIDLIF